ncbi:MAG: hypothetical protein AAFX99_33565, partial [Myxococcota bacterium]
TDGASQADCLLGCGLSMACLTCVIPKLLTCSPCAVPFLEQEECFTHCAVNTGILGGHINACLKDTCEEGYSQLISCIDPALETGLCDAVLDPCGITR